jgi:type II secretory pathway pseudopilin PulG
MTAHLRRGLSLFELLAVLVVLACVGRIVLLRVQNQTASTAESACLQNKAQINSAVERFLLEKGKLPRRLSDLNRPAYFPDGLPTCPVSGLAYSLDRHTKRVAGHNLGTH